MSAPIGYLVPAVLVGLAVFFVLAPLKTARRFGPAGFLLGVVDEIPFLAFMWLAGSTALAFAQDTVHTFVGWLAFGLSVAGMLGLLVMIGYSLKARRIVRDALDEGLGNGWTETIRPGLAKKLSRLTPAVVLGPLFRRRAGVQHMRNLNYAGDDSWSHTLDVYRGRSPSGKRPVLVHLHSGGLRGGRKDKDALPLLYYLAKRGWLCVSANYRLSPEATWPEHLVDAKRAIAWVREHASEFGADPHTIFIAGGSSGGQLAALVALTAHDRQLQPGFERADTSVCAAISLYGDYDWTETSDLKGRSGYLAPILKHVSDERAVRRDASPVMRVHKNAPPFFIWHGTHDTTLPVADARVFAAKLRAVSKNPVVYAELPGAQHNFDQFNSIRAQVAARAIEGFADWVLASRRKV
ncbi:MAG TPA: alpha/beta hydrolase [Candidatus Saccharimonadales bacterium]|nr:alpha/beta hydrolase [Candidatus Saccharimonadales bacterium]